GETDEAPRLGDVLNALEQPGLSAVVNLGALRLESRQAFSAALLLQLLALHDRVGRPHCVLIDQAQSFLSADTASLTARLSEVTMIYSTAQPDLLPQQIVKRVKLIVTLCARGPAPQSPRGGTVEAQTTTAGGS